MAGQAETLVALRRGHEPPTRALPPGLAAALRALATAPCSELELAALVTDADGDSGLFRLHPLLMAFDAAGRLEHSVRLDGEMLARLRPLADRPPGRRRLPSGPLTLSRFAIIRPNAGNLQVQAANGQHAVELAPAAVPLLAGLADGTTPEELAGPLPHDAVTGVLGLLHAAGAVVGSAARDAEDTEPAVARWPVPDLWLHTVSRSNRAVGGYGPTAPHAGGFPAPPAVPPARGGRTVALPRPATAPLPRSGPAARPGTADLDTLLAARRSIRAHDDAAPITLDQLAALLHRVARSWGVHRVPTVSRTGEVLGEHEVLARPYPAGGGLHELELYPVVTRCAGLDPGLWHYRGTDHVLEHVAEPTPALRSLVGAAAAGGQFPADPQVLLVVTARFGRVQQLYQGMAYALILRDVGVLYQTLYLAGAAMGLACCALGGGDAADFAEASGLDPLVEGSVGEFTLGSALLTEIGSADDVSIPARNPSRAEARATEAATLGSGPTGCETRIAGEEFQGVREEIQMESQERAEFVNSFTKLLTKAWSDDQFAAKLDNNPKEAAAEVGLTVPAQGEVVIVRDFEGEYSDDHNARIDAQIALWETGKDTGRYELHVPRTPQIDTAELSESELEGVAGGYCCCCPCCCCA